MEKKKTNVNMPIASNNIFPDMSFSCITLDVQVNYVFKLGENEFYHILLVLTFNRGYLSVMNCKVDDDRST